VSPKAAILAVLILSIASVESRAQSSTAPGWYASDPAGMAFEPIAGFEGHEFALRVTEREGSVLSELFKDGSPFKEWIRAYGPGGVLSREAYSREGVIKEESLYDAAGRRVLERFFLDNGTIEETEYEYSSGRLASKATSRGGDPIATVSYFYAPDGRLALTKESTGLSFGTDESRIAGGSRGGSSTWRIGPDGLELRRYDSSGRLATIFSYRGAQLASREDRSWKDGRLERSVVESSDGAMTIIEYETEGAAAGEPRTSTRKKDGAVVSAESREYDDEGRVSLIRTSSGAAETVAEYGYGETGELTTVRTSKAGILVSVVRHESATVRVEEFFDSGVAFARVRYEDGRRVLEEILRDGRVVRSRSFK